MISVLKPTVKLITYTQNPELIVALSSKICYAKDFKKHINNPDQIDIPKSIQTLVKNQHFSPIEHASFTFYISDISRACMAQLTRHRIASFSVRSQRYINESNFSYVRPKTPQCQYGIDNFSNDLDTIIKNINKVYKLFKKNKVNNEDARSILPNATTTQLICTMNARSLHNFFKLRLCKRAQTEIRSVAKLMLQEVSKVAPNLFLNAGPNCTNCSEQDKPFECEERLKRLKKFK